MTRRVEWAALGAGVLPLVVEVEKTAYSHPWTVGHFSDTLNAGHHTQVLLGEPLPGDVALPTLPDGRVLVGYLVAMQILDEVHLLNLTVTPALQRQGWGRLLLDGLALWARGQQAQWLWLEVRASNAAALAAYRQRGFAEVGRRRDYYPLDNSRREDAIVMSLNLKVAA